MTAHVLVIIVVATVLRLVLAAVVGLGIDESYHVGISREFSLSYFDHPPLSLWLAGAWGRVFGEHPLVIRVPFILLSAGSTWLMYRLTATLYSDRAGVWAATAFNLAPVFTISTGSWVLPDGPLMFCLLLAATSVARAVFGERREASQWLWLGAGMAAGLALLSKYTALCSLVGVGLFLLSSDAHRQWLKRRDAWLAAALALVMCTPVLLWNGQHGFASFLFQGQRATSFEFRPDWLLQNVLGQALYLLPSIAAVLVLAAWRSARAVSEQDRFLFWLSAPMIVGFLLLALTTRVLPHWPMAGWLFVFPIAGDLLARWDAAHSRRMRLLRAWTVAVVVTIAGVIGSHAATGWISRIVSLPRDPSLELFDWRQLRGALEARGMASSDLVATGHWMEAGKVNYALGGRTTVLCVCADARHFQFISPSDAFVGSDAFIVTQEPHRLAALAARFERVEPLPDIILTRAGQPAVILKVAIGRRFASQ